MQALQRFKSGLPPGAGGGSGELLRAAAKALVALIIDQRHLLRERARHAAPPRRLAIAKVPRFSAARGLEPPVFAVLHHHCCPPGRTPSAPLAPTVPGNDSSGEEDDSGQHGTARPAARGGAAWASIASSSLLDFDAFVVKDPAAGATFDTFPSFEEQVWSGDLPPPTDDGSSAGAFSATPLHTSGPPSVAFGDFSTSFSDFDVPFEFEAVLPPAPATPSAPPVHSAAFAAAAVSPPAQPSSPQATAPVTAPAFASVTAPLAAEDGWDPHWFNTKADPIGASSADPTDPFAAPPATFATNGAEQLPRSPEPASMWEKIRQNPIGTFGANLGVRTRGGADGIGGSQPWQAPGAVGSAFAARPSEDPFADLVAGIVGSGGRK